jgi:hypothetical protein
VSLSHLRSASTFSFVSRVSYTNPSMAMGSLDGPATLTAIRGQYNMTMGINNCGYS